MQTIQWWASLNISKYYTFVNESDMKCQYSNTNMMPYNAAFQDSNNQLKFDQLLWRVNFDK